MSPDQAVFTASADGQVAWSYQRSSADEIILNYEVRWAEEAGQTGYWYEEGNAMFYDESASSYRIETLEAGKTYRAELVVTVQRNGEDEYVVSETVTFTYGGNQGQE